MSTDNIFFLAKINELVMKKQNSPAKMADAFRNCGCAVCLDIIDAPDR